MPIPDSPNPRGIKIAGELAFLISLAGFQNTYQLFKLFSILSIKLYSSAEKDYIS